MASNTNKLLGIAALSVMAASLAWVLWLNVVAEEAPRMETQFFANGFTGCKVTCDQDYTAGSNNAGSFTVEYDFGAINNGKVRGTVSKQ